MDKIKILVIPKDREEKNIKRIVEPHLYLDDNKSDKFFVDIDMDPDDNDEYFKEYDVIVYHEYVDASFAKRLEDLGVVGILDIDDNWSINKNSPFYKYVKHQEEAVIKTIKSAQHITTSTPGLYDKIKGYNSNVTLIADGVDKSKVKVVDNPSDKIRVGLILDDYSLDNVKFLDGLSTKLKSDKLLDKVQFVLCGFHTDFHDNRRNEVTGEDEKVKRKPEETVWYEYEKILTNNHKLLSEEYRDYLHEFKKGDYDDSNEPYRRIWVDNKDGLNTYYNNVDVVLAPLSKNNYNETRSPFKVMEAGMYGKAIIAQDYGPYKIDLVNGYDKNTVCSNGNSLLVDFKRNHSAWYKHLKKLILVPGLRTILVDNLSLTVSDKYSMESVTDKRANLYSSLVTKTK
jgi:hypothetical protein